MINNYVSSALLTKEMPAYVPLFAVQPPHTSFPNGAVHFLPYLIFLSPFNLIVHCLFLHGVRVICSW